MSIFKKTSDVMDLTKLEKRGIKIHKEKTEPPVQEYVNLSDTTTQTEPTANQFDFLNNLANTNTEILPTYQSQTPDISIKIENLEYKIERFLERLDFIEKKINDFERKVG